MQVWMKAITDNIDEANAELVVASEQGRPDPPPCSYDKFCLLGRLDITRLITVLGHFSIWMTVSDLSPPALICIGFPTIRPQRWTFDCFE
jgi:hypothetical protein